MKSTNLILAALALGSLTMTSCRDDFADTNINKQAVVKGEISFLFAEAVNKFDPQAYLEYYYNAPMKYAWSGMGLPSGGASESILTMTATGDQGSQYINVLRVVRAIEHEMESLDEAGQANNATYLAAARVLAAYLGIYDTDMYGSIPFIEACKAAYGGTLTPEYDSVQSLYDLWLGELDSAIATFTATGAQMATAEDVVYGGDVKKWAKFANSLKLRIAVRLLNQDAAKAKSIASQVASASCGYLDSLDDAVLFNKGKNRLTGDEGYVNDRLYHWSNGFSGTTARETVVNFMVENQDPRVRFFYKKNQWNSKIVQGFYDAGKEIPEFIEKNVVYEVGADGKKHFVKWGGLGEPWVRYYGMTEEWNAGVNVTAKNKWYFPTQYGNAEVETQIKNKDEQNPTAYTAYSTLNQMMIIGRQYTAASQVSASTLPDDVYTFKSDDRPWFGMYMGAGETNLYLAEFAMLNGDEASAQKYYTKGLECSVQEFNKLAEANQVAYHSSVSGCFGYDPNEGAIDLKDGEIETMLKGEGYQLTGTAAEKLEKIYIQELLHFTLYPNEVYVTARRSGYPSYNSNILPRAKYAEVPETSIPRRFPTGSIDDSDLTADVRRAAYAAQGLTVTSDGLFDLKLNSERLWMDQGAPAWGAGK